MGTGAARQLAIGGIFLACMHVFPGLASAQQADHWPDVLSLEFALSRLSLEHPDLQLANAALANARARQLLAESRYGLEASLEGRLRWIEPSTLAADQSSDDHRLGLFASKPLYDFGRSSAFAEAASNAVSGEEYLLREAVNQHRLRTMSAYFDVLLADLGKARDEEAMSGAFIRADRAEDRNKLGQLSDIDLFEARSEYQRVRENWYRSRDAQRTTRARLAEVLDRPGQLPAELAAPLLPDNAREVPAEIDAWLAEAEQGNPLLAGLRMQLASAEQNHKAAQAHDNPLLLGEAELAEYSRDTGSTDAWRAGLRLKVPLVSGARARAQRAQSHSELIRAGARLEQARRSIQQALLEQWAALRTLKVSQERASALVDYRNLYLDRSRALYELEVKSDLGNAMTLTSGARLESARVEYALALAWAQVDALLGRTVYDTGSRGLASAQHKEQDAVMHEEGKP